MMYNTVKPRSHWYDIVGIVSLSCDWGLTIRYDTTYSFNTFFTVTIRYNTIRYYILSMQFFTVSFFRNFG